jgi:HD-like signal output (HDOD) protein
MSKILKIVNSAMYALPNPVASMSQATALLGFTAIKNIATTTSVFSTFDMDGGDKRSRFNRQEFWKHSIVVGIAMNVLYDYVRTNIKSIIASDILHLAGLTHGIGIIIFEQFFHVKFTFALILAQKEKVSLLEAERNSLGADHCEIGAWLGRKWNLPPEVIEAIRWHSQPELAHPDFRDIVNLCHTAKYICTLKKLGDYGDSVAVFKPEVWKALGLTLQDISDILDEVLERAKDSEALLALAKE